VLINRFYLFYLPLLKPNFMLRFSFLLTLCVSISMQCLSQSSVYFRNSTWQDFEIEATQSGTYLINTSEWSTSDTLSHGWLEAPDIEILSINRTNTAVPEGDTVYFNLALNGNTDSLTIRLRIIGISGGTELDFSVAGSGFSEPWYNDANFHEIATTMAGKDVIIKFKPDNDDSNMDRNLRFVIHNVEVYEIDPADFQNPNALNVMFYNLQMITFGLSGLGQASERAALITASFSPYQDVVCFQEVFDDSPRNDELIPAMEAVGFPYRTDILNPPGFIPIPTNGGVMTFSRWPIEREEMVEFAECGEAAQDCLASKGIMYTRINKLGKRYHIFGTHMDAGGGADDIFARRTQMAEMRDMIAAMEIPEGEAVILGGDFNTNPIDSDNDYLAFLDTVSPVIPQHIGNYESNFSEEFGNIIDHGWGDRNHLVATHITNEVVTFRSLDPVLWDISEFSDHRAVISRFTYPDIEQSGGDTLICPGNNLTLAVNTTYSVTYQWYLSGQMLNGETNSELQLISVSESQSGNYTCLVSYDEIYGDWGDSLTALFFPFGIDTVEARLIYDFGEVIIDQILCSVGILETNNGAFSLYPNPTSGLVSVNIPNHMGQVEMQMFNLLGKRVLSTPMNGTGFLDVASYDSGVYILELTNNKGVFRRRLIVY